MVSVHSCGIAPHEPLLAVHMWTGVIIHVHFVLAAAKTRVIRRILQESTDIGIGSLFLVARDLIPEPDLRLTVPEWLLALHALAHERIYTVDYAAEQLHLGQVHFDPIGSTGDMVARHGPAPKLDRLRFLRTAIRPRYIKGEWQLADFGVEAFWKDQYAPRHNTGTGNTYHRPDPREYRWKSWSTTGWEQPRSEDIPKLVIPHLDRIANAYELLEVDRGSNRDEVRAAYRKLALSFHPDTSTLPTSEAEAKFRQLNEALEIIYVANKWT